MDYEQTKHLKPAEFKQFWGVKLETFKQMVEIVHQYEGQKKKKWIKEREELSVQRTVMEVDKCCQS